MHRLSHDRLREALRRLIRHLFFALVGDQRELSVLSWPWDGPRDLGEDKSAGDKTGPRYGLAVDFAGMDPHAKVDACAMCHSRRSELTGTFDAGQHLMDQFLPANLRAGFYFADGQQEDEVYAFGSFRQSKMYQLGVTCMDCHDVHSGRLKAEGNAVCTQCHSPTGHRRFPTAAKLFDDPSHHHHQPGSKGAECTTCHMPAKTYMGVHSRPDHSLVIPRPDLAATLGVPNACTSCHADKPAAWATEAIERWYGVERTKGANFADAFAAGRAGNPDGAARLDRLTDDPQTPAIVRATALELLRGYGEAVFPQAIRSLDDTDPAVRRSALAALGRDAARHSAGSGWPLIDRSRSRRSHRGRTRAVVRAGGRVRRGQARQV